MHRCCEIVIYTILLSDVHGIILLLLVRVRNVESARTWLPTLFYCLLQQIIFKAIAILNVVRISQLFTSAVESRLYELQKFTLKTCSNKPEADIMMPPLDSEVKM